MDSSVWDYAPDASVLGKRKTTAHTIHTPTTHTTHTTHTPHTAHTTPTTHTPHTHTTHTTAPPSIQPSHRYFTDNNNNQSMASVLASASRATPIMNHRVNISTFSKNQIIVRPTKSITKSVTQPSHSNIKSIYDLVHRPREASTSFQKSLNLPKSQPPTNTIQSEPHRKNEEPLPRVENPQPHEEQKSLLSPPTNPSAEDSVKLVTNIAPLATSSIQPAEDHLLTDRYRPNCIRKIVGQKQNVETLQTWLTQRRQLDSATRMFPVAFMYGSPGLGKTCTAHIVLKENGYNVTELNASMRQVDHEMGGHNQKDPQALKSFILDVITRQSLNSRADSPKQCALILDEIDCDSTGDKDVAVVLKSIIQWAHKNPHISQYWSPIICIANKHSKKSIRNLMTLTLNIPFKAAPASFLVHHLKQICTQEKLYHRDMDYIIQQIGLSANGDIRRALNMLETYIPLFQGQCTTLSSSRQAMTQTLRNSHQDQFFNMFQMTQQVLYQPLDSSVVSASASASASASTSASVTLSSTYPHETPLEHNARLIQSDLDIMLLMVEFNMAGYFEPQIKLHTPISNQVETLSDMASWYDSLSLCDVILHTQPAFATYDVETDYNRDIPATLLAATMGHRAHHPPVKSSPDIKFTDFFTQSAKYKQTSQHYQTYLYGMSLIDKVTLYNHILLLIEHGDHYLSQVIPYLTRFNEDQWHSLSARYGQNWHKMGQDIFGSTHVGYFSTPVDLLIIPKNTSQILSSSASSTCKHAHYSSSTTTSNPSTSTIRTYRFQKKPSKPKPKTQTQITSKHKLHPNLKSKSKSQSFIPR
jgi:hypothetical protein